MTCLFFSCVLHSGILTPNLSLTFMILTHLGYLFCTVSLNLSLSVSGWLDSGYASLAVTSQRLNSEPLKYDPLFPSHSAGARLPTPLPHHLPHWLSHSSLSPCAPTSLWSGASMGIFPVPPHLWLRKERGEGKEECPYAFIKYTKVRWFSCDRLRTIVSFPFVMQAFCYLD